MIPQTRIIYANDNLLCHVPNGTKMIQVHQSLTRSSSSPIGNHGEIVTYNKAVYIFDDIVYHHTSNVIYKNSTILYKFSENVTILFIDFMDDDLYICIGKDEGYTIALDSSIPNTYHEWNISKNLTCSVNNRHTLERCEIAPSTIVGKLKSVSEVLPRWKHIIN